MSDKTVMLQLPEGEQRGGAASPVDHSDVVAASMTASEDTWARSERERRAEIESRNRLVVENYNHSVAEFRAVRSLDALSENARAEATGNMARAAGVVGTAGLTGLALGGPVGAVVGVGVGMVLDAVLPQSKTVRSVARPPELPKLEE